MSKQRGRRNFTEPVLPNTVILDEDGVLVRHFYGNDHAPPHLHVTDGGVERLNETRVGQNGHPLESNPSLTAIQHDVIRRNIGVIRKAVRKIGRWYWYQQL